MKIKTIPRMLAVLVLCLTTMMSLTLSAFAVNDNANDTGEHGAGYTSLPSYDDTEYGYRISVVDGNTGEVIGSFDLGNLSGADTYYTGTGTDPSTNGGQGDFNVGHMDMPAGMPPPLNWTGESFTSNGDAVNNWLMSDNDKGVQNVVDLVLQKYPDQADAIKAGLNSGAIKIANEPMANLPVYTLEPVGTTRDGKTVVSVIDEKGRTWNYWQNADGSAYRVNGTIRDYVLNELRPNGGGCTGSFMGPVVKGLVEAFFLDHVDNDIKIDTMSAEELESLIDDILLNWNLDKLGVGMHLYDMSEGGTPPPPPTPSAGEADIHITESRITRRKNLTDSKLGDSGEKLGTHKFEWNIEAFSDAIKACTGCHHSSKSITDKTNTINVEQSIDNQEAQGVIKPWSHMTDGGDFSTDRFVRTWTARTVGKDKYKFSGAGYCIVVIRKDDTIDLINYRLYGNEGTIDGISSIVVNTDSTAGRGRYANGSGYAFDVNLHYEPNEGMWGYDKKTVYTHTDKKNTTPSPSPTNPNPLL